MHAPHAAEVEITAAILARRQVAEVGQTSVAKAWPKLQEVKETEAS